VRTDFGVIDTMVQIYVDSERPELPIPKEQLRDRESREAWPSYGVVSYIYGEAGEREELSTDLGRVIEELDKWGIVRAQIPVHPTSSEEFLALIDSHADRFFGTLRLNPHDGYDAVRSLQELGTAHPWIRSVSIMPALLYPPIAPNSREFYPIYAKCIELNIPVMLNVGFGGPRSPSAVQDPMHLDEVAWFFPDLRIVMKHGGEPWADVCVRLMQKWPNVFYATTAFTPRRYPQAIVDYLRRSGREKVIYGGYFPSLSFDRLFGELAALDLPDEAAEKFLHSNALKVFGLE
jgi:predicted TIM-barrel fold metal-dependent hydrolase